MTDIKETAAITAIEIGGVVIVLVVAAAVAIAVIGGNLIDLVTTLL